MMGLGDIKAAVMVVRAMREDWDHRTVTDEVNKLAAEYNHRDVLYALVTVAQEPNNRAPVTLSIKAGDIITKLHEKARSPRTYSAGRRDDGFLCDVCSKTEAQCQTAATNLNGFDHSFKSIRRAEVERGQERAKDNPETAANKQAARDGLRRWGESLADGHADLAELTKIHHPEAQSSEQESA